jgi:ABC-type lipoprotein export system ATPase subunit
MSILSMRNVDIGGDAGPLFSSLSLEIEPGELCCIRTGTLDGSTSLLKCMAGIREVDSGSCLIKGRPLHSYGDRELPKLVSFCHEDGGLLSLFNVFENIVLPLVYHWGIDPEAVRDRAVAVCEALRIRNCLERRVHQLNDVQRRLSNLARGLILESELLLVDELQEGMSPAMRDSVLDYLVEVCRDKGLSLVMTTTAGDRTGFADRQFEIRDRDLKELRRDLE